MDVNSKGKYWKVLCNVRFILFFKFIMGDE